MACGGSIAPAKVSLIQLGLFWRPEGATVRTCPRRVPPQLFSGLATPQRRTLTIEPAHRTVIHQYTVKEHIRPAHVTTALGATTPDDVDFQPLPKRGPRTFERSGTTNFSTGTKSCFRRTAVVAAFFVPADSSWDCHFALHLHRTCEVHLAVNWTA